MGLMKLFLAAAVAVFLLATDAVVEEIVHPMDSAGVAAGRMEAKKADVSTNVSITSDLTEITDKVMVMAVGTLEDAFVQLETFGRIFGCEDAAAVVIRRNRHQLALVKDRLAAVPLQARKRVARVMAGKGLSSPGDNSFYASFLKSAMAVSDDHQKGLLPQLAVFDDLCCSVTGRLSGRSGYSPGDFPMVEGMPVVMAKAFGALVVGIRDKADQRTVP